MPGNEWSENVKKSLKAKGMNYEDLARKCGYSRSLIRDVINGCYYSPNIDLFTDRINNVCNTTGRPPLDHDTEHNLWRKEVKKKLIDRDETLADVSLHTGLKTDLISNVLKGRFRNAEVADCINKYLEINAIGTKLIDN